MISWDGNLSQDYGTIFIATYKPAFLHLHSTSTQLRPANKLVIVPRFRDYFIYFMNPQIKVSKRKRHVNNFLAFIVPESKVRNSHKDNLHETNVLRNKKYVWCGKRRWFLWMSVVCWLLKYITEAHTSTQTLEKKIISQNSIFFLLFLVNSLETFCYNKSRNNLKRRDSDLTLIDLWRKS